MGGVYEQHAGNQDCRTADSPQKVITHVQVITSQQSGRPQSTAKVTKNEVPDNHSERVWDIAQVLAVEVMVIDGQISTGIAQPDILSDWVFSNKTQ